MIPTLEYYFRQIALVLHAMRQLQATLRRAGATIDAEGIVLPRQTDHETLPLEAMRERYYSLCREHDALMDELLGAGVEILDAALGVVNFHSWWDGEEVVLNWQFGEPTVQFWMDPGELPIMRRPIRQLFFDAPTTLPHRH